MPKVTIEFTLPDEQAEFEQACAAGRMQSALSEFRNWLRNKRKYEPVPPTVDAIWDEFHRIASEYGLDEYV